MMSRALSTATLGTVHGRNVGCDSTSTLCAANLLDTMRNTPHSNPASNDGWQCGGYFSASAKRRLYFSIKKRIFDNDSGDKILMFFPTSFSRS
jgi:hypothetical protein